MSHHGHRLSPPWGGAAGGTGLQRIPDVAKVLSLTMTIDELMVDLGGGGWRGGGGGGINCCS